jgi:Mn2+/Fe2+ NRAMP family transporter
LGIGLFAAGFCCVITSPYSAAIIARTVFEVKDERKIKAVWISVLAIGFLVGISGAKPIPVILLVQALNGLILPFLVVFLIIISNDHTIMPVQHRHGLLFNIVLLLTLFGITLMGLNNIDMVIISVLSIQSKGHYAIVIALSAIVTVVTAWSVFRNGFLSARTLE